MFRDPGIIIGLIFVGFFLGLPFHLRNYDCAIGRVAPIPKTTATLHVYRHTPHASLFQ
jgi:hypothetical protein